MEKRYLFTPGPTPVPPEVLAASAEPMVHHRGADFREISASELIDRSLRDRDLKVLLDPKQEIEQVHRRETQIVKEKLLLRDRFSFRQRQCLTYQGYNLRQSVA